MDRPITTLFMLASVDGKISTGCNDIRDFDADLPMISGVSEGLYQYYMAEQETDVWSFCTGKTLEKADIKSKVWDKPKSSVCYAIYDNGHLSLGAIKYLCDKATRVVIYSKAPSAFDKQCVEMFYNLYYVYIQNNLGEIFEDLYNNRYCQSLTIQSGGTMNSTLLRAGFIDYIDIVVTPILIGGRNTPTIIDGEDIYSTGDLCKLRPLSLESSEVLSNSYVRLRYKVL